jgi:hypothetical protein
MKATMKIGKIKGSDPEEFFIQTESDDPKAMFRGDFLTEQELRDVMTKGGASKLEIDQLIEQARKHEVE